MNRAAKLFARATEIAPDDYQAPALAAQPLEESGQPERALEWGRRAAETAPPEDVTTHYNLGCFYARVGDRDKALERLERCVSLAGGFREWIAHDRDWDSLRGDPRFEELLTRLP